MNYEIGDCKPFFSLLIFLDNNHLLILNDVFIFYFILDIIIVLSLLTFNTPNFLNYIYIRSEVINILTHVSYLKPGCIYVNNKQIYNNYYTNTSQN